MLRRLYGLVRSLVMYYGVPGRRAAQERLYGQFLRAGDVGIDVGAHVGSRVRSWRALGARVIAVEPQPDCVRLLERFFGGDPGVVIEPVAVGAAPGRASMRVSVASPTVSSLSAAWVERMERSPVFAGVKWDREITVEVTTLDALIARHGAPAFVKIDVEGFEPEVLAGLSRAVPALSFEFLPPAMDHALACLDRLETLGRWEYNYSPIETMRFASETWLGRADLEAELRRRVPLGRSGDVYARLVSPASSTTTAAATSSV